MRMNPYRGIYTELAAEDGVTPQAIIHRVRRRHADTLSRVAAKILAREGSVRRHADAVKR